MQLPVYTNLKSGIQIELDYMHSHETEDVRKLLNRIILEGKSYPQQQSLTELEFKAYWLVGDSFVVKAVNQSNQSPLPKILAAFYIKPNFPGKCSHICNAGFIVQPQMRGQGIGRFMGETMLGIAQALGYQAVIFNLVFETNIPSIRLWQSLGFQTIGSIPAAVELEDSTYIDALVMYRQLEVKS
ncbi:MAG: GNAT family N-acetyltransferase [Rivularia sp. (in: Bacteria)]|nr:GNAT family N-acetyltransferase [Rivularia sp. MS3]